MSFSETEVERKRAASRLASKRYYERHKEKVKTRTLAHGQKPEVKERQKVLRIENEEVALRKAAWKKANPHKIAAYRRRRRGVKANATPLWAGDEWEDLLMAEIYTLAKLRTRLTGFEWHVDHVIPLVSQLVCGLHCSANLRVVPAKINLSKGNKYAP